MTMKYNIIRLKTFFKRLLQTKRVNNFFSRYLIYNDYSLYPFLKERISNVKYAFILSSLFLPVSIVLRLILKNKLDAKDIVKNDYVYAFHRNEKEVKFQLKNYKTDLIEKLLFENSEFYEEEILNDLSIYLSSSSIVLDIGANIGNHTIYFSVISQVAQVYSFEPILETFERLANNIKLNQCENVTLFNCGLGAENSFAEADNLTFGNNGAMKIKYSHDSNSIIVKPLDDFYFSSKVDFMKIDVEGFEEEVLKGGVNRIKMDRPVIFIEIHKQNYFRVEECLKKLDYRLERQYNDDNYLFFPLSNS